ncbi:MarP family serine protease [Euzebya tangerina]|uniref:MarP family serine protease n=1 Tax=Euzebya tangerina TaxID=591198 RepID=UPI0013C32922|nr:MarP family serine protease [Euzebya tangerina]
MNIIDLVLGVLLLGAAIRGWRQGALSQVFAFGGAAVGLVLGGMVAPSVAAQFVDRPGVALSLATFAILIAAILAGQALGFYLGYRLRTAAESKGVGVADSLAGIVVGLSTLVVTLWIAASVLANGPSAPIARVIQGSTILAQIDDTLPPPPDIFGRVASFLDTQGFPQVFAGLGGSTAPPVDPPAGELVGAAAAAGTPATVQIEARGCGGVSAGSGVAVQPGFIVTNAHVVAGTGQVSVRDAGGTHDAIAIHVDPALDLAVISSPTATATPLPWATVPADRGTSGASLGFPGGSRDLNVLPAAVRGREEAIGRDIYGGSLTTREVLTLEAPVRPGDSGGPFVNAAGEIAGIVFAASTTDPGVGFALTAERVRPDVDAAIARNAPASTGACRF